MSTVAEIKAAAAELSVDDQLELFQWLAHSDALRKRRIEDLKREVQIGIDQINSGQYTTYDSDSLAEMLKDISERGRRELAKRQRS